MNAMGCVSAQPILVDGRATLREPNGFADIINSRKVCV